MPAKWRTELSANVVVTRGLEGCLSIFPLAKFEQIASEIDRQGMQFADSRMWARYIGGKAEPVDVDAQGRVLIPQSLREYAGLDGNVVVVGLMSRIEVWSPEKYKAIDDEVESNAAAVAEKMGQMMLRIAAPEKQ